MRSLKFRVSRNSLEKMCFTYIRPLLEYSEVVWDNCSTATKKQLDAIHVEAARIISGATKLCGIGKLFADLGWESLQARPDKHKLIVFFKILQGLTPNYLSDMVPPLVQDPTISETLNIYNNPELIPTSFEIHSSRPRFVLGTVSQMT